MSYVGDPFQHDLFISYSHGAIKGMDESKLKVWSTGLVRELESELRSFPKYATALRIFLDTDHRPGQGVDPMSALTDQLKAEIGAAALLVVLMSPHYLLSDWCRSEREWWLESQKALDLPTCDRIAPLKIWNMTEPWPDMLNDSAGKPRRGFLFYDETLGPAYPQPFEWPAPINKTEGKFNKAMNHLVATLDVKLEEWQAILDKRRRRSEEAAKLRADSGQVLYLHGRPEQNRIWQRAGDALVEEGFAVLPTEPEPVESDVRKIQSGRRKRIEALSACDAILLLGTEDGSALSADLAVVGRQDRQSARALSDRLLPCAVLATAQTETEPNRRRAARMMDIDWIQAAREPWNPRIQDWLTQSSASV